MEKHDGKEDLEILKQHQSQFHENKKAVALRRGGRGGSLQGPLASLL